MRLTAMILALLCLLPAFADVRVAVPDAPRVGEEIDVGEGYTWKLYGDRHGIGYLAKGGSIIGVYYRPADGKPGSYHEWVGKEIGKKVPLPCQLPPHWRGDIVDTPKSEAAPMPKMVPEPEPIPNYGVVSEKIAEAPPYSINGQACTRAEAKQAIENGQLPDDANKIRLTVIGQEMERKAVLNDLAASPLLVPYRDRVVVQEYAPNEWPVLCGFKTDGRPSIYLQKPDGKVLHRQADYADGPRGLATALRKVDPTYNAEKDPDLRKSSPLSGLKFQPWMLAAGAFGLYLFMKKEESK